MTARVSDAFSWRSLEGCGLVVGAVDALVGCGLPVLVDCVGDLFDDLAEGCFLVGVVVFVVGVGEVCPDLLFRGGDVCVYVGGHPRYVRGGLVMEAFDVIPTACEVWFRIVRTRNVYYNFHYGYWKKRTPFTKLKEKRPVRIYVFQI